MKQLLFALFLLAINALTVAAAEPHRPIVITSDADLINPLSAETTGLRSGTGTAQDPWIISGWEIDATTSMPGIDMANVQGHVEFRDITIRGTDGGALGALVMDNDNVVLDGVNFTGAGEAFTVTRSTANLSNVEVSVIGSGNCIRFDAASIRANTIQVSGLCGFAAFDVVDSTVTIADSNFMDAGQGMRTKDSTLILENTFWSGTQDRHEDSELATGEIGLLIQGGSFDATNLNMTGWQTTAVSLRNPATPVNFNDVVISDSEDGIYLITEDNSITMGLNEARFQNVLTAIQVDGPARATITNAAFMQAERGLYATDSASIETEKCSFQDTDTYAGTDAQSSITIHDCTVDGTGRFSGDVETTDVTTEPPPSPTEQSPGLPTAILILAIIVISWKRP